MSWLHIIQERWRVRTMHCMNLPGVSWIKTKLLCAQWYISIDWSTRPIDAALGNQIRSKLDLYSNAELTLRSNEWLLLAQNARVCCFWFDNSTLWMRQLCPISCPEVGVSSESFICFIIRQMSAKFGQNKKKTVRVEVKGTTDFTTNRTVLLSGVALPVLHSFEGNLFICKMKVL